MAKPTPNPKVVGETFDHLHVEGQCLEVRVIDPATTSASSTIQGIGYFDSRTAFVVAATHANMAGHNIYVGINPRPLGLLDRARNTLAGLKQGARASDIKIISSLYIDVDPVRPSNTASTDAELGVARAAGEAASKYVESLGLIAPVAVMSGNGVQLWFAFPPIDLTDANRAAVTANLKAFEGEIRRIITDKRVKVDSTHDLPRIAKLVGTVSFKGEATPERPHRVSHPFGEFVRREDPVLRERLLAPTEPSSKKNGRRNLLVVPSTVTDAAAVNEASPPWIGGRPAALKCSPARQLWDQGIPADRSVAIFDLVRFLAHADLGEQQIVDIILTWDRTLGGGKLVDRPGAKQYVTNAYAKVVDGTGNVPIPPACKSLQHHGLCAVDGMRNRCEVSSPVVDVGYSLALIPKDIDAGALRYRVQPILDSLALGTESDRSHALDRIVARFPGSAAWLPEELDCAVERLAARRTATNDHGRDVQDADADLDFTSRRSFNGEVWCEDHNYVALRGKTPHVISSFVLKVERIIDTETGAVFAVNVEPDDGGPSTMVFLPRSAFNSRPEFLRHLKSTNHQWTGNDNEVQGVLRLLAGQGAPRRRGTVVLGARFDADCRVFVFAGGAIDKDGFTSAAPIEYVPTSNAIDRSLRLEPTDDMTFLDVAKTIYRELPRINEPGVIGPIVGWAFAAPAKPFFMSSLRAFPILNVTGTGGSGKTSTISEVVLPLLGVPDPDTYSAVKTPFTLIKALASTTSVPQFIDEYKPLEMPATAVENLHRYLRHAYKGSSEERGRPDQTVVAYELQAPIVLAGESRPKDAALLERCITAMPAKGSVERDEYAGSFTALTRAPLHLFAARYIQFLLGRQLERDFTTASTKVDDIVGTRRLPPRIRKSLQVMATGAELYQQFAESLGLTEVEPLDLKAAIDAVLSDLIGSADKPQNGLDRLLEELPTLVLNGLAKAGVHFAVRDGKLFLHLDSVVAAHRRHNLGIGERTGLVDTADLRRMAQENRDAAGYVVAVGSPEYLTPSNRKRVVVIDIARAAHLIAPDDFGATPAGPAGWPELPRPT